MVANPLHDLSEHILAHAFNPQLLKQYVELHPEAEPLHAWVIALRLIQVGPPTQALELHILVVGIPQVALHRPLQLLQELYVDARMKKK